MLIAVVSDTHRIQIYIDKVKEMIKKADILIHLGDNVDDAEYISKGFKGKVYVVRGNCDFSTKYPNEEIIRLDEKTIFITHGHNYSVKSSLTNIFYTPSPPFSTNMSVPRPMYKSPVCQSLTPTAKENRPG